MIAHLTPAEREHIVHTLKTSPLGSAKGAPNGIQITLRAGLEGSALDVLIKPDLGPEHKNGVNHLVVDREVAAYVLDEAIGLGMVPPTVRRNGVIPDERGDMHDASLQMWVDGGSESGDLEAVPSHDIRRAAAFDLAIRAIDRMEHNWITVHCERCATAHLVLIDHAWCFDWTHHSGEPINILGSTIVEIAESLGGPDIGVLRQIGSDSAQAALATVLDQHLVDRVAERVAETLARMAA